MPHRFANTLYKEGIIDKKEFEKEIKVREEALISKLEAQKNTELTNGLKTKNFTEAISNLDMNYSNVVDKKGDVQKKYSAGLCLRSLKRMNHACGIYGKDIPDEILKSANETYQLGLDLLEKDKENGKYSESTYDNAIAWYKNTCEDLFHGKLSSASDDENNKLEGNNQNKKNKEPDSNVSKEKESQKVNVGDKTYTAGELRKGAIAGAKNDPGFKDVKNPYIDRPYPVVNGKNQIEASCEIFNSTHSGNLNNKIVIVNAGHGGYCPNNGFFDSGTVLSVKNAEGNQMPIEEWRVAKIYCKALTEELNSHGATVILVSGAVLNGGMAKTEYLEHLLKGERGPNDVRETMKNAKKKDISLISIHVESNKEKPSDKACTARVQYNDDNDSIFAGYLSQGIRGQLYNLAPEMKWDNLYVTRVMGKQIPAVLLELGNIANENVCKSLLSHTDGYKYVKGIADGLVDYYKNGN